jgi:hypothetical protein
MADPAPVGSDVSAGTYRCTNCGYELTVQSVQSLPPCPKCEGPYSWQAITGVTARKIRIPGSSCRGCAGARPLRRWRERTSSPRGSGSGGSSRVGAA